MSLLIVSYLLYELQLYKLFVSRQVIIYLHMQTDIVDLEIFHRYIKIRSLFVT